MINQIRGQSNSVFRVNGNIPPGDGAFALGAAFTQSILVLSSRRGLLLPIECLNNCALFSTVNLLGLIFVGRFVR